VLIAIVATVVGGIAVCVLVFRLMARRRQEPRRPAPTHEPALEQLIAPHDVAELEARWGSLDADHRRRCDELLMSRLRPLVNRRVPVRVVEPIPARRVVRIRFADGTAVVGRGEVAGDTGVLMSLVSKQSVWPGSFTTDDAGAHVVFSWSGGRCMTVLVTGLDQPD
jgi:hypothetical protein